MVLRAGTYVAGMLEPIAIERGVLRHLEIAGERRAAERPQVDVQHDVAACRQPLGDPRRGLQLRRRGAGRSGS